MSFICQVDVFANKVILDPDAIDHVRKASMEQDVSKPASLALQVSKLRREGKKRITNEVNYGQKKKLRSLYYTQCSVITKLIFSS